MTEYLLGASYHARPFRDGHSKISKMQFLPLRSVPHRQPGATVRFSRWTAWTDLKHKTSMIRIQGAYERPIKEVEFYFIKMVIIVILIIYVDSLINWETTAKSRWPMGSWTKATEVSLERKKQTWESLSKWKQQNLTLWLWRVRDEEASKNHTSDRKGSNAADGWAGWREAHHWVCWIPSAFVTSPRGDREKQQYFVGFTPARWELWCSTSPMLLLWQIQGAEPLDR